MAKLHIICGNCGCNDMFTYSINDQGHCDNDGNESPAVYILCGNCITSHDLIDNAKEETDSDRSQKQID